MAYCPYESLVGREVIVFHPNPQNRAFAVIGTLEGVGNTALGIAKWRWLDIETLHEGRASQEPLVINKQHGFRRIALFTDELPFLEQRMAAMREEFQRKLESFNEGGVTERATRGRSLTPSDVSPP